MTTSCSYLPCESPIVAGLVDLHEKHNIEVYSLREVCTHCCDNTLEEFISLRDKKMEGMKIGKGFNEEKFEEVLEKLRM